MREGLKKHLRDLGADIKTGDRAAIADKIDTRHNATETSWEQQEQVYEIQMEKQKIMEELKSALEAIKTDQEPTEPLGKRAIYDKDTQMFIVEGYNGQVTRGDIMTDMIWGTYYQMDADTVPRIMRKQYLVELAKCKLSKLLERQVGFDAGMFTKPDAKISQQAVKDKIHNHEKLSEGEYGFVAERLAVNVLRKKQFDEASPLRVVESDVDLEPQKVDFIVRVPHHLRGVDIELDNREGQTKTIAVQLKTLKTKNTTKRYRSPIIDRARKSLVNNEEYSIDDLIGIKVDSSQVMSAYNNWAHAGYPPGGPEKFLNEDFKQSLVNSILKDILPKGKTEERQTKIRELQDEVMQYVLLELKLPDLVPSERRIIKSFVKREPKNRLKDWALVQEIAGEIATGMTKAPPEALLDRYRQYETKLEDADEQRMVKQEKRIADLIERLRNQREEVDFVYRSIERGDTFTHPRLNSLIERFQKHPGWKKLQPNELEALCYFLRPELMYMDLLQHDLDEVDEGAFEGVSVRKIKDTIQEEYRANLSQRLKGITLRMEIYRDMQGKKR